MYTVCTLGHRHWGTLGAAGGLIVAPGENGPWLLLTLRSAQVHHGNTWSLPGGAIDAGDIDAHAAASREIREELGIDVSALPELARHEFECGGWTYTTVVFATSSDLPPATLGWETQADAWLSLAEIDRLAAEGVLHPGFAASWPALRQLVGDWWLKRQHTSSAAESDACFAGGVVTP